MRFTLVFAWLCLAASFAFAQDPFALGVRDTPHRSPEEEQKLFKLPEGFEIQLVAAEPAIQKPLNMAFDGRGRLWVTDTVEYPYAAPLDKPGRDTIKVIEFDYTTGKATKITTFADGLNIPIGVLPYKNGCIAHSIPNIWYFEDTDGDGQCDKRTVLYGPFDHTRDTHGMENAFRRGFDGWIYACHGFNNDSHVKGADGHEVHLQSGNTFRFKPDGSRIEHYSHGQVNPFGMCFDDLFNIFTADCHSKPITQILRGGYYESFGKPHDGLGYVPPMMDHLHGSTAICGLVWVDGEMFPQEYRDNFLSGNVMTSRINRNKRIYHGSTIKCQEQPDFLSTGDPWFRPVDLQIGPDGALYIADFYNRIIGHYEVPLPHPGRDRTSGRIWRVVYRSEKAKGKGEKEEEGRGQKAEGRSEDGEGKGQKAKGKSEEVATRPAVKQRDLTKTSVEELIEELDNPTLTQRLLATDELVNRGAVRGAVDAQKLTSAQVQSKPESHARAHLLWVIERLGWGAGSQGSLVQWAQQTNGKEVLVETMKILAESRDIDPTVNVNWMLNQQDGFVARAAADAVARHPKPKYLGPLLSRLKRVPAEDTHLDYVLRLAIRETLSSFKDVKELEEHQVALNDHLDQLAPIALGAPNLLGAAVSVAVIREGKEPRDRQLQFLTHAARYAEGSVVTEVISLVRERWTDDLDLQLRALLALQQGLAQRGQSAEPLMAWAEELGGKVLDEATTGVIAWENFAASGDKPAENPWVFQARASADGNKDALFYSSLVKGEEKTGLLRSQPFELPEKLSFWCAGHIGPPGKSFDLNYIRLRSEKGELLAEARPPRNDLAQRIEWDLAKHKGQRGYVEIIDGDAGGAYAWLAVGRFSVSGLNPNESANRQQLVAKLATELKLKNLQPRLAVLLTSGTLDAATRGSIGSALVSLSPDARAAALVRVVSEPGTEIAARQDLAQAIASLEDEQLEKALAAALKQVPARTQSAVAEALAGDAKGLTLLLDFVEEGKVAATVLRSPAVQQKIAALKNPALQMQADELTAKLPPANEVLEKLIAERRAAFDKAQPNPERGAEVFAKNCAACHQIAGKGAVVGPQLDGIGQRGLDRILEDVLDPNRNVDVAFRATTLALADGRVLSGLVKGEQGAQLIVVDNQGKEQRIAKDEVEERTVTTLSLMPANVHEIVPADDFQHLVGYLLQQKAKRE